MIHFCEDCGTVLTDEQRENWEGCPVDEDVDEDGELVDAVEEAEIDADELIAELEGGA